MMKFFFARIFPWPFFIAGAVTLCFGVRGVVRARASVRWPTADGKVVSSSVESDHSSGGNGGGTTYQAEILYEFSVDGTIYNGNRVAYGDYGSSNPSHARNIVNQYPVGKELTVYYMPSEPEESLLEPGMQTQAWFLPGFGLVFLCTGSGMLVFLPKLVAKVDQGVAPNQRMQRADSR